MEEGVEGLLRDKTRPSRIAAWGGCGRARGGAHACDPPGETTHWTGAMMAKASGISVSSVQRIWRAHGLRPHKVEQFKLSNDPKFVDKLRDVVGLYVDPPAHAIVLSVDEKSQIQALDRTQPGPSHEEGPRRDHDPRLQAQRHHDAVRRARRARRQGDRPLHAAPPPSGVHPLPQHHRSQSSGLEKRSMSFSTTTPRTSTRRFSLGWPGTSASLSTSRRPRVHGSMRWRVTSPSFPGGG